jgi:hypothetical protein
VERHNLCVVLYRPPRDVAEADFGIRGGDPTVMPANRGDHRDEQSVLVEVRESSEDCEGIVTRNLRSRIRLQPLDECPLVAPNRFYVRNALHLEAALVRVDRERRLPGLLRSLRRKLIREVIERGAHVPKRVTNGQGQLARRRLSDDCVQDMIARLVRRGSGSDRNPKGGGSRSQKALISSPTDSMCASARSSFR